MPIVPIDIAAGVQRNVARTHVEKMWSVANGRLKPGDPVQIHEDVQRKTFAAVPTGEVAIGIFYLSFEAATDQILLVSTEALTNQTNLNFSPAGSSGAWTQATFISGIATKAWIVHRGNQYFLGTDLQNVLITSPTSFVEMGMDPTLLTGGTLTVTGATTSNALEDDIYVYAVTEYDSVNDVEAFHKFLVGKIAAGTGSLNGNTITIDLIAVTPVNSRTTEFRVYRQRLKPDEFTSVLLVALALAAGTFVFQGGFLTTIALAASSTDALLDTSDPGIPYPRLWAQTSTVQLANDVFIKTRPFTDGVVYQDCVVVTNPATSKQVLRFSPPGLPEYQPDHYFMYFATERSDEIVGLRTVNDRLIVLLTTSIQRINYLPLEGNVRADAGRIQEVITGREGCVGRQAHTKVETQRGELVVWLSPGGLRWTDGQGMEDCCPDFTVAGAGIAVADLASAMLVNDPANYRLRLYVGTAIWDFYYQQVQLVNGAKMKCLGPSTGVASLIGKCYGPVNSIETVFVATATVVYIEVEPTAISTMTVETGYINGANSEKLIQIEQSGMTHTGGSPVITQTGYGKFQGQPEVATSDQRLRDAPVGNAQLVHEGTAMSRFDSMTIGQRLRMKSTVADVTFSVGPMYLGALEMGGPNG